MRADGYDFLQRLRRELGADANELPAIAITGYASTEDKVRAFTSGFQSHLAKPFQAANLFRLVRMSPRRADRAVPPRRSLGRLL